MYYQVFFIDTSGALCSRASGHAIDVEGKNSRVRDLSICH